MRGAGDGGVSHFARRHIRGIKGEGRCPSIWTVPALNALQSGRVRHTGMEIHPSLAHCLERATMPPQRTTTTEDSESFCARLCSWLASFEAGDASSLNEFYFEKTLLAFTLETLAHIAG